MINLKEYVDTLEDLGITQVQFFYLYTLHTKKFSLLRRYIGLYPSNDNTTIGQRNIDDLVARGLLKVTNSTTEINKYVTTEKLNKYLLDKYGAYEIYEIYPIQQKSIDKYQFKILYTEEIDFSKVKHTKIKRLVKYAIKENIGLPSITDFIKLQFWNEIEKLKKNIQKK